jgi:hypothetical protein
MGEAPKDGPKAEPMTADAALASMAKLVVPNNDPKGALPISYEVRNLHNGRPVAIASASAHQLVNEVSSPYQYVVRIDKMKINDTFRSFAGLGIGHQDGEFHLDVSEAGKQIGTIDKKLDEGETSMADNLPLRSGPRQISLGFTLRERDDRKGKWGSPPIDLAALRKLPGNSQQFVDAKFDKGNQVYFTVIVFPPELPKE